MMDDFAETTLGNLLSFANGRSSPERADGLPFPVYGSNGVIGHASEANADAGSLIIGRVGSYCGSLYLSKQQCWVTDNAICATARGDNDSRFLFYLLSTLSLNNWRTGSGQPLLNQDILTRIPALAPLPALQRVIAHILGTLDEKIELNRRMNETLEAMARALFKSWFVDFDPVRAKTEARDPGLPKHIADLFPDRFENSELGEIPAGWKVKTIGDVAERVGMGPFGSSIKVETFRPEGVPIISGQHLNGFMLEDNKFNFISGEHAERLSSSNVYRGDVVFTHAGSIGQAAYIPECSRYERYVISQRQFFMRCDRSQISPSFIAIYFNSPKGQHQLLANTSSSGVPSIARPVTYLRTIELVIPPKSVLNAFDTLTSPVLLRFRLNFDESETLSTLRDKLLPKLISGELRVSDAGRFIGEAV